MLKAVDQATVSRHPLNTVSSDLEGAALRRTHALLTHQTVELRRELATLRQDIANAQKSGGVHNSDALIEANEQLVLAVLHSESVAETALSGLRQAIHANQRDVLTGLPNRTLILDRLTKAIAMARRRGVRIAVLFVDIDRFKSINDTLGHKVGDEVLRLVANRIESAVREADSVGRLSGDEFVVVLAEISQASDAALIAAKVLQSVSRPSQVAGRALTLSASIGMAIFPEDGDEATVLIDRADVSMYHSKRRGPGGFESHRVWLNHESNPALDDDEEAMAFTDLGLGHDKHHAIDLREANEQLVAAALEARSAEADANAALRKQVTFLRMVAHQLRNPLTPILHAAELMHRSPGDDPRMKRLQGVVKSQVAHMARLIDDLLGGLQTGMGKFLIERSIVDLKEVVLSAIDSVQPSIDMRRQRLTIEICDEPCLVDGDPVRLSQVFRNLLDNASKYTPDEGWIGLSMEALDDTVVVRLSDSGVGIAAQALPRLFNMFVQDADARPPEGSGGWGVGLAVVREIVESHGGVVTASSPGRNRGSEFRIALPSIAGSEASS